MEYTIHVTGTRPLLLSNAKYSADPDSDSAKKLAKLTKKSAKQRTEEDRYNIAYIEWMQALYRDEDLGVVLPSQNIRKSLIEAARLTKMGKKIERGLTVLDDAQLLVDGKPLSDSVDKYWNGGKGEFVDRQIVRVSSGSKVVRCRPIFDNWSATFDVIVDPALVDEDLLVEVSETAGKQIGVGDYRPLYGRYEAEVVA